VRLLFFAGWGHTFSKCELLPLAHGEIGGRATSRQASQAVGRSVGQSSGRRLPGARVVPVACP